MGGGVAVDIAAGAIAGIAAISVIHPLDVIRTRIQTDKNRNGAVSIFRSILASNGVKGLYAGFTPPLAAQAVYKAVIFTSIGFSKSLMLGQKNGNEERLLMIHFAICGATAGIMNSLVVCPVELVRNRLILASQNNISPYSGPIDCIKHILKNDGLVGFYRGWIATLLRDGPGLSAWFTAFNTAKKTIPKFTNLKENDNITLLLSGSCSGITFWTIALPMDAIKSIIQTSYGNQNNAEIFINKIKDIGILKFIRGLYRGYPIAIARGIPASAIVFFVNQRATSFLQEYF